ncbi:MAG TPA: prolipoprotein diacylglyceryl transferase [Acidimicrobiales bacterium]|nr:prolipoprotein diacylglyceryl transferase [Acidimicrobiales bacterium]
MLSYISYHPVVRILHISPHGVGIAVGFLLGARLMLPEANRKGITEEDVYALLTRAAIGAIIGARIAYVVNHLSDYNHPLDALKIWQGGISLLGGIFGAVLLALPEMKKRKLSFWKVMDSAAPGIALGVIIGRIGDLIVGDHLGKPTHFFLGFKCPPPNINTASPCVGTVVHQTALYDFLLTIPLLFFLLWLRRKHRYDGFLLFVFATWYGVGRLIEDFLREDVRHFGMTGSQWTAAATMAICLFMLVFRRRTPRWGRWETSPEASGDTAREEQPLEPPTVAPAEPTEPEVTEES